MIRRNTFLWLSLSLVSLLFSCKPTTPQRQPTSIHLSQGSAIFYGDYYREDGITSNVITLDLFTSSLQLDSVITGSGHNLYIQDLFVGESTTLAEGTYQADSTGQAMTFLRGICYDQSYVGAVMHSITDGKTAGIVPLTEGEMVVSKSGDSTFITFTCKGTDGLTYKGDYRGILSISMPQ